jgi:hypothetical protein
MVKTYTNRHTNGIKFSQLATIVLAVAVIGTGSYFLYHHYKQPATTAGHWTYLGTASDAATVLGGNSNMATYACVDKLSGTEWIVKAKATLSPATATASNYTLTLSEWPFQNVADAPGGQSEAPRAQVKSNSWSGNDLTTVQLNATPSEKNYIQVTATSKGHGGKILPTPFSDPPLASQLATC